MTDLNWIRSELLEDTKRLSDVADAQIAWLQSEGFPVDELALSFDDEAVNAEQLLHAGLLSAEAFTALKVLDEQLGSMSGPANASMWTTEALRSDSAWATVRSLAENLLQALTASEGR